jgi:hypothetical protein
VSAYLTECLEQSRAAREVYEQNPPPVVLRLRKIKEQLAAYPPEERSAALQRILAAEKIEQQEPAPVP